MLKLNQIKKKKTKEILTGRTKFYVGNISPCSYERKMAANLCERKDK